MASSSQHFFNTPELLELLTSHLEKEDISQLSRTNRTMNSRFSHSLFKILDIYEVSNIFTSTTSTLALGRNTRHVRDLSLGSEELAYYYNCVQAFEELKEQTIDNVPAPRPSWYPPMDPRTCQVVTIPPMTRLTQIYVSSDIDLCALLSGRDNSYRMPSASNPQATLAHRCWLLSLNPRLTSLSAYFIEINDRFSYRLFIKAISGLNKLKMLRLPIKCPLQMSGQLAMDLFHRVQSSIQSLHISLHDSNKPSDQEPTGVDHDLVMPPRRQGPLRNLLVMKLWRMDDQTATADILSIFAHCPNIEELHICSMSGNRDMAVIGEFIGRRCPKVQTLQCNPQNNEQDDSLPFYIIRALPPQQITNFQVAGARADMSYPTAVTAIQQHSSTLRRLVLQWFGGFKRMTSSVIFDTCGNLETLDINFGVYIDLADAQGSRWRCTKLRDLTLGISSCELPVDNQDQPYYSRPFPITLSQVENGHFSQLEKLYMQIGRLTELRKLRLNMVVPDEEGEMGLPFEHNLNSFPAMLSLGSIWEGRPGYLHHLAALSKLEMFTGSICANTEENKATMDFKECVWIDDHWPQLFYVRFFSDLESVRAPFAWLQEQRKYGRPQLSLE
ncbi:hypothetical protein BGX24_004239 [Mortierella sp. AD032]|nr:hypothetical protein BGX24_004239 [Mortierella sp. AD032]